MADSSMAGFGRLHIPDERDADYPLTADPSDVEVTSVLWGAPRAMDQGDTPQCVAYAWVGALAAYPTPRPRGTAEWAALPDQRDLYCHAQRHDPWEGDCTNPRYDGTSVRGGANALRGSGLISEFRWAWDMDTALAHLVQYGPIVVGTRWLAGMSDPDAEGIIRATGRSVGGHAYVIVGYDADRDLLDGLNSWGRGWGPRGGRFWIPTDDLRRLIENGDGEVCVGQE